MCPPLCDRSKTEFSMSTLVFSLRDLNASVLSGMLLQRKEDLGLSDGSPQNVVCGCGHTKFYAKFNDAVHTLLFEPLGMIRAN